MTDKEFKKLGRAELIEIIYRMQQNEEQLRDENNNLRKKLASKNVKLSNAGSIAEAALALNGVFESAQKAADDYLALVHLSEEEIAEKNNAAIAEANEKAAEIVKSAEKKAADMLKAAEKASRQKWEDVNRNIDMLLESNSSLLSALHPDEKEPAKTSRAKGKKKDSDKKAPLPETKEEEEEEEEEQIPEEQLPEEKPSEEKAPESEEKE